MNYKVFEAYGVTDRELQDKIFNLVLATIPRGAAELLSEEQIDSMVESWLIYNDYGIKPPAAESQTDSAPVSKYDTVVHGSELIDMLRPVFSEFDIEDDYVMGEILEDIKRVKSGEVVDNMTVHEVEDAVREFMLPRW